MIKKTVNSLRINVVMSFPSRRLKSEFRFLFFMEGKAIEAAKIGRICDLGKEEL